MPWAILDKSGHVDQLLDWWAQMNLSDQSGPNMSIMYLSDQNELNMSIEPDIPIMSLKDQIGLSG